MRRPRLRPRAILHRRITRLVAELFLALPAVVDRAGLNDVHPSEPIIDLGHAAGRHPHHHPSAEPPAVPPGGMGADALSEADHPAQPAPDPDRTVASAAGADRSARLALRAPRPPAFEPDGPRELAGGRRAGEPCLPDRRLSEHGLRGRRTGRLSSRARSRRRSARGDTRRRSLHAGHDFGPGCAGLPRSRGGSPRGARR